MKGLQPLNANSNYYIQNVKILDASGKVIEQQQFSGNPKKVQVDVSGLADGIYFIEISDGKNIETQKLVIGKQ